MGILDHPAVASFDERVDAAFDRLRGNALADRVFYAASEAANHSILWHALTWSRALVRPQQRTNGARISLALGVESAVVNGPVKMMFRRERPTQQQDRPHALRTPRTSSFPSGHATSAFCAAMLLSRKSNIGPLYFVLAAVVAASRVHVRIHHASDVVAGAAFGTTVGWFARRILR